MTSSNRPADQSAAHVWLIVFKASHSIEQVALRSVSAMGLGLSDFAVLEVLLHKGALPVNTIGRKVLLSSGSITAAIDRLAARRLVQRKPDPGDGRFRIVELTRAGQALIEKAFRQHGIDMEGAMAVLNARERKELVRLLKKVGLWSEAILGDPPA